MAAKQQLPDPIDLLLQQMAQGKVTPQAFLQQLMFLPNNPQTQPTPGGRARRAKASKKKGKSVTKKSATIDKDVEYFTPYDVEFTVEPPLDPSAVTAFNKDKEFIKLKAHKLEDVVFVDGQITVVSENVTKVDFQHQGKSDLYGYIGMKKEIEELVALGKAKSSTVTGMAGFRATTDRPVFWRIVADSGKTQVEEPLLRWPDGTTTPFPSS